jgi:hypothetical protein
MKPSARLRAGLATLLDLTTNASAVIPSYIGSAASKCLAREALGERNIDLTRGHEKWRITGITVSEHVLATGQRGE